MSSNDPITSLPAAPRGIGPIWTVVIGSAIALIGVVVYQNIALEPAEAAKKALCMPPPRGGTIDILEPAVMRRSDVLFSAIEFTNDSGRRLALYLVSPADGTRYAVAHANPGQTTTLSAPIGTYGLLMEHGDLWCGGVKGYAEGIQVRSNSSFNNEAGKSVRIQIGHASGRFTLAYSYQVPVQPQVATAQTPPTFLVPNAGFIDLQQDSFGHYFIDGAIGGLPLRFMIDTGATTTAVSAEFAQRAQILNNCASVTTRTANGLATGCQTKVYEMSFGAFHAMNVDVMVLPDLPGPPLLGMNVLRNFSIEQRGSVMRISYPGAPAS